MFEMSHSFMGGSLLRLLELRIAVHICTEYINKFCISLHLMVYVDFIKSTNE